MGACHSRGKDNKNRPKQVYASTDADNYIPGDIKLAASQSRAATEDEPKDQYAIYQKHIDEKAKVDKQLKDFIDPEVGIEELVKVHPFPHDAYKPDAKYSRILLNRDSERYRYFGEMKDGLKDGFGVLYNLLSDCLMVGTFSHDLPDGQFQLYYPDGKYEEAIYTAGFRQ